MAMHYFDPMRESDPHALPDLEVFYRTATANRADNWRDGDGDLLPAGWFYWACFPGCLPDSEPCGPFESEADALADARESAGYDDGPDTYSNDEPSAADAALNLQPVASWSAADRDKPATNLPTDNDGKLSAYAWPGGYPIIYLTDDAAVLCPACANGQNGSEASPTADAGSGWRIVAADVHWEGSPETCAHCGAQIASAYGPVDEPAPEPDPQPAERKRLEPGATFPMREIGGTYDGESAEYLGAGKFAAAQPVQPEPESIAAFLSADRPRLMLVYQAGIANVFMVDAFNLAPHGRNARRLLQSDFRTCESFARGAEAVGAIVYSAGCNMAGDITDALWSDDLGPFREEARPVDRPAGRKAGD